MRIIGTYRLRPNGHRGSIVSVPQEWKELNAIKNGDRLIQSIDNKGRLIIESAKARPA
jgi:hypothetical protein